MARGYNTAADILTRTRDGQDLNAIWQAYQEALAAFNATRQPLIDLLSFSVDQTIEDLTQPGQEKFERATEFGVPQAMRPSPTVTQRAYPFEWWDTRAGYTQQFLMGGRSGRAVTQMQLDQVLNQVMEADNQLQFEQVMKALFNSANRAADLNGVSYTVTALYNADSSYIPPYKGKSFTAATHTHYLGTGAGGQTKFDPGDITEAANHIEEHGYTRANGYNILILMNGTDIDAGPATYVRNTNFNNGAANVLSIYDYIPAMGQNLAIQLPPGYTLVGGLPPNTFAGLEVTGSWGPYLFIKDAQIPEGYMVAVATRGQNTNTNVVGIREHEDAALRGLVLKPGNFSNYPLVNSYFLRGLGTGIGPRGAAVVMQVGVAAGAYSVPATYAW